ncbi:hypothetical protein IHV25_06270 [Phaeovibrio sulfidiphilus]|uniref:OmpA-like domain-containing protein n=1 Tax=Phaeovibrio sulfidiphilus TaxID=1220600 RepID=A0A8J7CDS9_9PROT|nr:OmpA family protein [Phaeovibrio sulfidiphilus]MBE1237249.1 hypothetical protein [Phaeovibrio sulfidiphilus]
MTVVTSRILRLFAVSASLPLLATLPSDAGAAWNADVRSVLPAGGPSLVVPVNDGGLLMPDGRYPNSYGPSELGYYDFGPEGSDARPPSRGPVSRSFLPGSQPNAHRSRSSGPGAGSAAPSAAASEPVSAPRTVSERPDPPAERVPAVVPPASAAPSAASRYPAPAPAPEPEDMAASAEPEPTPAPPAAPAAPEPPPVSRPSSASPLVAPPSPPEVPDLRSLPRSEPIRRPPVAEAPPAAPVAPPAVTAAPEAPPSQPVARAPAPAPDIQPFLDGEAALPPLALFPSVSPPAVAVPGTASERVHKARQEAGPEPVAETPPPAPVVERKVYEPGPPLVMGMMSLDQLDDPVIPGMSITAQTPLPGRAMTVAPGYQKDAMDMTLPGSAAPEAPSRAPDGAATGAAAVPPASAPDRDPVSAPSASSSQITGAIGIPGVSRPAPQSPAPQSQAPGPVPLVPDPASSAAPVAPAVTAAPEPPAVDPAAGSSAAAPVEVAKAVVEYTPEATAIPESDVALLERFAALVLENGERRLLIQAYAGANDETGPNRARRVSLTRALAIRTFMLGRGVPGDRIEVRALGEQGARDGKPDRTDVIVMSR